MRFVNNQSLLHMTVVTMSLSSRSVGGELVSNHLNKCHSLPMLPIPPNSVEHVRCALDAVKRANGATLERGVRSRMST